MPNDPVTDPVVEMLLEGAEEAQAEKQAHANQLQRIETLLGVLIEEFRGLMASKQGAILNGKPRSITITSRDESERIKTFEVS